MGLKWSKSKEISQNTKLFMTTPFPEDIPQEYIWFIWKNCKNRLKADGFGVKKYKDVWYISYTININDDSFDDVETSRGDTIKRWHHDRNILVRTYAKPLKATIKIWAPFITLKNNTKSEYDEINNAMDELN